MSESRRQYFRIVYPVVERPLFDVGRKLHEVIDVSERGLRYEVKDRRVPAIGTELTGVIQFRRGDNVEVSGTVIRTHEGMVILALDPGMPYSEILGEQRHLRSRGYDLKG